MEEYRKAIKLLTINDEDRLRVELSTTEGKLRTELQKVKDDHSLYAIRVHETFTQLTGQMKQMQTEIDRLRASKQKDKTRSK